MPGDAKSTDVYSTDEVDELLDAQAERITALESRVTVLEAGGGSTPPPNPEPGPMPEGVELSIEFIAPDLTQGVATHLAATVMNTGDTAVPPGYDTVIGIGYFCDGVQATWASTDAGLEPGAELVLDTATAPMSGGAWRPAEAGGHVLTAWVDDLNRIPEWDDENNRVEVNVTIAEGVPPPEGAATLWTADSSWNTVKNPTQFDGAADGLLSSKNYGVNNGPYSHPMTYSTADDPIHTFQMPNSWGWPAGEVKANMRDDATPAAGTDGHLCLINADGRTLDMWILQSTGHRSWRCEAWAQHNWQTGNGWGAPPSGPSAGVTVSGAPTAAGTITAAEVEAGVIPHALCMAFASNDMHAPQVPPAIANDASGGGPLQEGALLFAVGDEPGGLNDAERALWVAASTYGCFIVDKLDGDPMFYGDRSDAVGNAFRWEQTSAIGKRLRRVAT